MKSFHIHTLNSSSDFRGGATQYSRLQGYKYLAHKKHPPNRIIIGLWAYGYCSVLRGGLFLMSKAPLYALGATPAVGGTSQVAQIFSGRYSICRCMEANSPMPAKKWLNLQALV